MREFKDKVAVVTGAASGIGRAMAELFAQEGMKIVLADIDVNVLSQAEKELRVNGAKVVAVPTDVSKGSQVERLAQETKKAFGAVHLLCNNAGVGTITSSWESPIAEWEWTLGVNLYGVIHGLRVFVPIMLAQDTECHIVNTASMAGLVSYQPRGAIYQVTKHAVVALTEHLYHELKQKKSKVKVSVLCPGFVNTPIMDNSERNRPDILKHNQAGMELTPEDADFVKMFCQSIQSGLPTQKVAEIIFNAIREDKFYILTHPRWKYMVQNRFEDILHDRNPSDPFKPI